MYVLQVCSEYCAQICLGRAGNYNVRSVRLTSMMMIMYIPVKNIIFYVVCLSC